MSNKLCILCFVIFAIYGCATTNNIIVENRNDRIIETHVRRALYYKDGNEEYFLIGASNANWHGSGHTISAFFKRTTSDGIHFKYMGIVIRSPYVHIDRIANVSCKVDRTNERKYVILNNGKISVFNIEDENICFDNIKAIVIDDINRMKEVAGPLANRTLEEMSYWDTKRISRKHE